MSTSPNDSISGLVQQPMLNCDASLFTSCVTDNAQQCDSFAGAEFGQAQGPFWDKGQVFFTADPSSTSPHPKDWQMRRLYMQPFKTAVASADARTPLQHTLLAAAPCVLLSPIQRTPGWNPSIVSFECCE